MTVIIETHPISWFIYGANVDAEINFNFPVSFVTEYQNYGEYATGTEFMLPFDSGYSGNSISGGIRYYPFFKKKKLDSFYLGTSLEYISSLYTHNALDEATHTFEFTEKTEMESFGLKAELGWRWIIGDRLTFTFGLFGGVYKNTYKQSGFLIGDENYDWDIDEGKYQSQLMNGMISGYKDGLEFTTGLVF
ncbi:MAG: hypothetical protein JW982_04000 [Spirochaetes bacterium]|nr:hypothetical protein [Spirochaetota bacterium]